MRFTEDEAVEVKAWVVQRLEDISDADSDVLADYVLALIRSDAPDETIRKASIENLEDFLKENTVKFVDEIFEKYNSKSEPAMDETADPTPMTLPPSSMPFAQSISPAEPAPFRSPPAGPSGSMARGGSQTGMGGRKRSFNDLSQGDEHDPHYRGNDRPFKSMRGRRGGRGDRAGGAWDNRRPAMGQQYPPSSASGFQGMAPLPPGFPPFDPNDPMSAMLALQSMAFSSLPGLPNLAQLGQGKPGSAPANGSQRCNNYDTQGFCVLGNTCPYQHGPDHATASSKDDEYDPAKSNILMDRPFSANGANGRSFASASRGGDMGRGRRGRGDRGGFGNRGRGRAEFSHAGPNEDQSITTIVVEQIPEDKFNDQTVRDFFSEFGNIVEINLKPYKHLALVKYDDYASAKRAWASPKVIFDNRFVKVYWYKPARGESNGHSHAEEQAFSQEEFEKQQADAQKAYEEKMQKRKETEQAMQALEKQKEELLKRQQEEKTRLLERLNAAGSNNGEKSDQTGGQDQVENGVPTDGQESSQTQQLRAQLAALEAEAQSLGLDPNASSESSRGRGFGQSRGRGSYYSRGGYPPRGRGYDPSFSRGGYRGRGSSFRGGRGGVLRLDNRPKKVAVSGVEFSTDRDEALRQYLLTIGEYESIERSAERPDSQIVTFKDRYLAEQLIYGPNDIPGVGKVEMTWVSNVATTGSAASAPTKKVDNDTVMGGDEPEILSTKKEAGHEVDYDVAEVEDTWEIS